MKTRCTLLASLFAASMSLVAQNQSLVGIWQAVKYTLDGRVLPDLAIKEYYADGTFVSLERRSGSKVPYEPPFRVTQRGVYTWVNDSTIHEMIGASVFNPQMAHKANPVKVIFKDEGRIVEASYKVDWRPETWREIWIRIYRPTTAVEHK